VFSVGVLNAGQWWAGVSKVDITPLEPLRLSGYAGREQPHIAVADQLHVRALALHWLDDTDAASLQQPLLVVSVDSIAVTGQVTDQVAKWLQEKHSIARSRLALCSTHSHTAPHLPSGLMNLFKQPMSEEQIAASQRYQQQVVQSICTAIDQALQSQISGVRVEFGMAEADFAVQRRVIENGRWKNFGVQKDGQVDRRVRVLRIRRGDGSLLAATYQYACHCTSLGPEFNKISGDWAGLSASRLENLYSAVFLPIIGCGGDANPDPRGSYDAARQNALKMVDAVKQVLETEDLTALPAPTRIQSGMVGLEPEQPTQQTFVQLSESQDVNQQRWAQHFQEVRQRMGRLPESSPMPVHVWTFGDNLNWIFMGAEVVVDYQFLIEKEMPTSQTWVTAYTNDCLGYVASQQQRDEGGYEVDYSMIYYLLPGRWKSGTQANILTRVREISQQERGEDEPLSAADALKSMVVPEGYQVQQVCAEPLIQDPVNLAFGWDGRVWVVEMSDYPVGASTGGCIRVLSDQDGDGSLEHSVRFLENLDYPTSVQPWRDGALIIAAPNILFARDTDGDGIADQQKVLISGVAPVNPQHRASGFELSLDGRLHFAVGEGTRKLVSHINGQTYEVRGHDVAWNPDTGSVEVFVQGHTQFVPSRDQYGNWYGNNNSEPMFQFVFLAADLHGKSLTSGSVQHLLNPPVAPPVFPRSRTVDRFNDLYTRDRYTSACGSMIVRVPGLGPSALKDNLQSEDLKSENRQSEIALICEPVHNLVARIQVHPQGSVHSAVRHPEDAQYDFFASTDPWSRPVRAVNSPDGSVWVVDMYRRVIEHPQWIPEAWQDRIDVRGGEGLGRIYRLFRNDYQPRKLVNWSQLDPLELLQSENSALRDLATQAIVTEQIPDRSADQWQIDIRKILADSPAPAVTASLLGVLAGKGWLQQSDLAQVLSASDHGPLVRWVLELATRFESPEPGLQAAVLAIPAKRLGAHVDLRWVLTVLRWSSFPAEAGLQTILRQGQPDRWLSEALTLADTPQMALPVLTMIFENVDHQAHTSESLQVHSSTVRRLIELLPDSQRAKLLDNYFPPAAEIQWSPAQVLLLISLREALNEDPAKKRHNELSQKALVALRDQQTPTEARWHLALLLGSQLIEVEQELQVMRELLDQGTEARSLAVARGRYVAADELAKELLDRWEQLGFQEQSNAASLLMSRAAWRDALVGGLESGVVQASQLPPAVVQGLIGHFDRNLRSRAVAVLGRPSPRQTIVEEYLEQMPNPNTHGQSDAGQQLYQMHCAVCHSGTPERPAIGPAVENLAHWTNHQWVTAIMDPSLVVEQKYKQTVVLSFSEEVYSGIVSTEDDQAITIVGSDGQSRKMLHADVQDRQSSHVSLMPDGFESRLSPQQLADLIQYLRTR
jgi:putative membrane-bound dehydrogenase-like protein